MGEMSSIEWTHHSFNPWWGCEKVSAACRSCYAEAWAKRTGHAVWGKESPRRFFGNAHWDEPVKWNRKAEQEGLRKRVFCSSMADLFEDRRDLDDHRRRLWALIVATPWLDWLLLTKRPQNIRSMLPWPTVSMLKPGLHVQPNVWLGTTVENQEEARRRIPLLLENHAVVHFLSMEPLLERVDLPYEVWRELDWIIVGGESGARPRELHQGWIERLVQDASATGVACFVKQLGGNYHDESGLVKLKNRKGGDIEEFPRRLQVREFPIPRRAA